MSQRDVGPVSDHRKFFSGLKIHVRIQWKLEWRDFMEIYLRRRRRSWTIKKYCNSVAYRTFFPRFFEKISIYRKWFCKTILNGVSMTVNKCTRKFCSSKNFFADTLFRIPTISTWKDEDVKSIILLLVLNIMPCFASNKKLFFFVC